MQEEFHGLWVAGVLALKTALFEIIMVLNHSAFNDTMNYYEITVNLFLCLSRLWKSLYLYGAQFNFACLNALAMLCP